jgi:hypothetical protein
MSFEDLDQDINELINDGYTFMIFPTKYFHFDRNIEVSMEDFIEYIEDTYHISLFKKINNEYIIFEIYGGYLMMKCIYNNGLSSINMVKFDYENQIGEAERYIC